jgi:hypothetical protein
MLALTQTVAPTEEPVTRDEAKLFAKITNRIEDDLVDELIEAARIAVETWTLRQLVTATWRLNLDAFPSRVYRGEDPRFPGIRPVNVPEIVIPRPPLSSVTSIKYYDTAGVQQTLNASVYDVDTDSEPGQVTLAFDGSWPNVRRQRKAIEILYVAGYGGASAVPANAKVAVKMLVNDAYEHREFRQEIKVEENPAVVDLLGDLRIVEAG